MRTIFGEKPDALELRLRMSGFRGQVWVWWPCVAAVACIATESTGTFSANNTSSWLRPIAERWIGHINDHLWWLMHHVFRKSGHFCGYGLVCLTFLRAWLLMLGGMAGLSRVGWRSRAVGLAVVSQALAASGDEWHQTFLPSRTGQFSDVLLDTCGGVVSCGLVWFFFWRGRRRGRRRI